MAPNLVHSHTLIKRKKKSFMIIYHCRRTGYPKTRGQIRVGGWWERRFAEVENSPRKGDPTASACVSAMENKSAMEEYFDIFLKEHSLFDKPAQIYNVDESGMPLHLML